MNQTQHLAKPDQSLQARVRAKADGIEAAEESHQNAPPKCGVQIGEHDGRPQGMRKFVKSGPCKYNAIGEGQNTDEEPDGKRC